MTDHRIKYLKNLVIDALHFLRELTEKVRFGSHEVAP